MAVIQFQMLSMAEAEQCIAEIWTCLEEYDIPSPTMSFEFHDPLRISITAHIDDPVAANTMLTRLSTWVATENGWLDRDRDLRLPIHTRSPIAYGGRAAAPLSVVVAAAAPRRSSYHVVSRSKRK